MTELKSALYDFWSAFDMPAFQQDSVPTGTALPYITYEVTRPPALNSLPLVAIAWFPPSLDGNMQRTALMDRIEAAIPEGGVKVPVDGKGFLVLDRNPSGFLSNYQDPEDTSVIGARVSYLVRFYIA